MNADGTTGAVASKPRRAAHPLALSFAVALFLALTANGAFWRALALHAPGGAAFLPVVFVVLVLALGLALALFALPYLWKPVAAGALLAAALAAHFMDAYGVVIDRSLIQRAVESDLREAYALVTPGLLRHVLVYGALPALLVAWVPLRFASWQREVLLRVLVGTGGIGLIASAISLQYPSFAPVARAHEELRLLINPTSPLWAVWRYWQERPEPGRAAPIAEDARRVVPGGLEGPPRDREIVYTERSHQLLS